MAVESSIPDFLSELRTDIAARLSVTVTTHPLGLDQAPVGAVQVANVEGWTSQQIAMGGRMQEDYDVIITITEKGTGRSETEWTAIRTALFAKAAEITDLCLDYIATPPSTTGIKHVEWIGGGLDPVIVGDKDPGYQLDLRLHVTAVLDP